ncbi:hypothetical protein FRACYDRAFT_240599 [Fragilariopsis cylindrus CCMP1102]|uniref:RNI-like protein n=1 Tax=Fragilariopsis cylindrus CCMP1102 TaxID=635003 RepID=A0A1E7FCP0_9STRA|nr:hypothetical protein FRACYDRAFT_240599 [Fragilariopsis cylindrus CCMP1102]|eukprot:OEU15904.1 hypothetical protein FRACYDRAFT_240599 [Fragilariopsis cylindrus CCMP1102]
MTIQHYLPATGAAVEKDNITTAATTAATAAVAAITNKYKRFVESYVPSDVNQQDAIVVVNIISNYATHFRLTRVDWNKIIRCCDPNNNGRITQLVLFDFDSSSDRMTMSYHHHHHRRRHKINNMNNQDYSYDLSATKETPLLLLSQLDKLEKLELRHCRSLPLSDLRAMNSLKWFNLCITKKDNFRIPENRNWYPPNMTTFMIRGFKVNGDPLDAIIATSIIMEIPPLLEDDDDGDNNSKEIKDILQEVNGIGRFVKYDKRTGRINELNLSGCINNDSRRNSSLHLPYTIGRLDMLTKLYLYNICDVPKEITNLIHLKVLRLDSCSELFDPQIKLPGIKELQIRHSCTYELLSWITTCFSGVQSLEILGIDTEEVHRVLHTLGGRFSSRCPSPNQQSSTTTTTTTTTAGSSCFMENLTKLHISLAVHDDYVEGLEDALFGILRIHPNLSKLYVERVGGRVVEEEEEEEEEEDNNLLEILMVKILKQYPRLRRLSIGGPNTITLDRHHRLNPSFSDRCAVLLNQNHCGRVLLMNQDILFWKVTPTKKDNNNNDDNNNIQKASAIYLLLRNGPALAMRKEFGFSFLKDKKCNSNVHAATSKVNSSIIVSESSDNNNPKYYTTMKTRQGTKKRKQRSFD